MTALALVSLRSASVQITVDPVGAALRTVEVANRNGLRDHIHLWLPDPTAYADRATNPYLGATCGRYANRIGGAAFVLDGVRHELAANDGPNQLHGGTDGFDRRTWTVVDQGAVPDGAWVVLGLISPDGDQGFPGELRATATYELEDSSLRITYAAVTDAPTVVNLCNHAYWNLGGSAAMTHAGSAGEHVLQVHAASVVPVGTDLIPTGGFEAVTDTVLDLRTPTVLADVLRAVPGGLDHSFATGATTDRLIDVAHLSHPGTGRTLAVRSNQPDLHVYTAGGLGPPFAPSAAVCLETQRFPDAPNRPDLGPCVLHPGDHYRSETELTFGLL